jgi:hypothetical protein
MCDLVFASLSLSPQVLHFERSFVDRNLFIVVLKLEMNAGQVKYSKVDFFFTQKTECKD